MSSSELHFQPFRKHIIGQDLMHPFTLGRRSILYADWAASGRMYRPIEEYLIHQLGPYMANTHTETTLTARVMTHAYHEAHRIIKEHVNANAGDCLLFAGFGMTAVINKFQRILGLRVPEQYKDCVAVDEKPLIIITHMEHHSNQTSWAECLADMEILRRKEDGLPDLDHLREILEANKRRRLIIGSFTACSNVTGIMTPYHEMAAIMHDYNRLCFVDFSASAAYVKIDMHPSDERQYLDAIFFSPHKFLGGPGSSGVIIFNKKLYQNKIPDNPGGGTVTWTNPWGGHHYFDDIEIREDGGTPGILQGIKAALAVMLKEQMGMDHIHRREQELKDRFVEGLDQLPGVVILERQQMQRMGYISFYVQGIHHNLIVRLLNDYFGIQSRGGCSCAGTYGHILLNIDFHESKRITDMIDVGDLSKKPGWVRVSLHPTMSNAEADYILEAVGEVIKHHQDWGKHYRFDHHLGDFVRSQDGEFLIDIRESKALF